MKATCSIMLPIFIVISTMRAPYHWMGIQTDDSPELKGGRNLASSSHFIYCTSGMYLEQIWFFSKRKVFLFVTASRGSTGSYQGILIMLKLLGSNKILGFEWVMGEISMYQIINMSCRWTVGRSWYAKCQNVYTCWVLTTKFSTQKPICINQISNKIVWTVQEKLTTL